MKAEFTHPLASAGGVRLPMMHPVSATEDMVAEPMMYVDPFIGWRAWNVVVERDAVRLQSITYKVVWEPENELVAKCMKQPNETIVSREEVIKKHSAPHKTHGCGIYAVRNQSQAARWASFGPFSGVRCFGEVKVWGTVFRFTKGFLSEFAYPYTVYVQHETPEDSPIDAREAVHELRRAYRGVEVRLL